MEPRVQAGDRPERVDGVAEFALSFQDLTVARVFIHECATPAAVIPLALTIEYTEGVTHDGISVPEYLSTAIFTTTVASVAVLTMLVAALQVGVPL